MTDTNGPSKSELQAIGIALINATASVRADHPDLEVVISYCIPRQQQHSQNNNIILATSMASTIDDPRAIVVLLVHNAKEVDEQMIRPFYIPLDKVPP